MNESKSHDEGRPAGDRPLIYLVDDEPLLLDLEEFSLSGQPWRVRKFEDAENAWRCFSNEEPKPDLLLTDFSMRGLNGLELAARCKELHPLLKVVLVSGTITPEAFLNGPAKVDRFLPKPFNPHRLLETVKSLMESNGVDSAGRG